MKPSSVCALLIAALILNSSALAVTIETVRVGNPGNAPDSTGFGSVTYSYRMGKYEVTNAQYVDFLNAVEPTGSNVLGLYGDYLALNENGGVLYDFANSPGAKYSVKPGYGDYPIVFATWYNAIRFANWLHNGQGGPGTTEYGAYTLLGGNTVPTNLNTLVRNPGARWFLPTENEWYKAAYHQPANQGGDIDSYWRYPTRTNSVPYSSEPPGTIAPDPSNAANFRKQDGLANGYNDGYAVTHSLDRLNQRYVTRVGGYTAASGPYGTFDQGGNALEWLQNPGPSAGILRGGGWTDEEQYLSSLTRPNGSRDNQYEYIGFRVAAIVPEPVAIQLAVGALIAANVRPRRRAILS